MYFRFCSLYYKNKGSIFNTAIHWFLQNVGIVYAYGEIKLKSNVSLREVEKSLIGYSTKSGIFDPLGTEFNVYVFHKTEGKNNPFHNYLPKYNLPRGYQNTECMNYNTKF